MSDQKNTKMDWNGVPREEINWNPIIDEDLCIGCGICVLNCGAKVYTFDKVKQKPIVSAPLKCKVGCVTCQNTCPGFAISFPSISYLHQIIKAKKVIQYTRNKIKEQ
jgi:CDP-4-dehydro-6-deoxyglucose reductase